MMGGLHILFNFMNAIGHMENAGLDDVWSLVHLHKILQIL